MNYELPKLKIVKLSNLKLHEVYDQKRVDKLKRRILKDNIFTNPPIVAQMPRSKNYVVLDGANRVTAARKLDFAYLVVQIVDYAKEVRIETWNHLIINPESCAKMLRYVQINSGFAEIKGRTIIKIQPIKSQKLESQLDFINSLFKLYQNKKFYRVMGNNFFHLAKEYKDARLLMEYPKFRPQDIIAITREGLKLPSGITRHIVNQRALGVDLPIKVLKQKVSLSSKNKFLGKFIEQKVKAQKVRFYQEPVVIFND